MFSDCFWPGNSKFHEVKIPLELNNVQNGSDEKRFLLRANFSAASTNVANFVFFFCFWQSNSNFCDVGKPLNSNNVQNG